MISFNAQFNATWTGIDINTLEGVMSARPTSKKKKKKKENRAIRNQIYRFDS